MARYHFLYANIIYLLDSNLNGIDTFLYTFKNTIKNYQNVKHFRIGYGDAKTVPLKINFTSGGFLNIKLQYAEYPMQYPFNVYDRYLLKNEKLYLIDRQ